MAETASTTDVPPHSPTWSTTASVDGDLVATLRTECEVLRVLACQPLIEFDLARADARVADVQADVRSALHAPLHFEFRRRANFSDETEYAEDIKYCLEGMCAILEAPRPLDVHGAAGLAGVLRRFAVDLTID